MKQTRRGFFAVLAGAFAGSKVQRAQAQRLKMVKLARAYGMSMSKISTIYGDFLFVDKWNKWDKGMES